MFGLNDNANGNNYADTTQMSASDTSAANPAALESAPPAPVSTTPDPGTSAPKATGMPSPSNPPQPSDPAAIKAPPAGINDVNLNSAYIDSGPAAPSKPDTTSDSPKPSAASLINGGNEDELLKLKQQALQSLAPLVDHLDQDPEEKFKTTMMMIQASDNADLIPDAYAAANQIPDEKVKAQALLDVVNEINYFTQHHTDV
jgi:hypothetical protein